MPGRVFSVSFGNVEKRYAFAAWLPQKQHLKPGWVPSIRFGNVEKRYALAAWLPQLAAWLPQGAAGHLTPGGSCWLARIAMFHTYGGPRRRPALASARQGRRIWGSGPNIATPPLPSFNLFLFDFWGQRLPTSTCSHDQISLDLHNNFFGAWFFPNFVQWISHAKCPYARPGLGHGLCILLGAQICFFLGRVDAQLPEATSTNDTGCSLVVNCYSWWWITSNSHSQSLITTGEHQHAPTILKSVWQCF